MHFSFQQVTNFFAILRLEHMTHRVGIDRLPLGTTQGFFCQRLGFQGGKGGEMISNIVFLLSGVEDREGSIFQAAGDVRLTG